MSLPQLPLILRQLEKNRRHKALFLLLLRAENFVNSDSLAGDLKVSTRTIKKDIQYFRETLSCYKIEIFSKPTYGYRLIIADEELEFSLKNHFQISQPLTINNKFQARVHYILRCLLSSPDLVKVETLQQALFLSSPLTKELNAVKLWLADYDLTLISKPYHGLMITGLPYKKMMLTVRMYKYFTSEHLRHSGVESFDQLFSCPEKEMIRNIFVNQIIESPIVFSDIYAERFILYLIFFQNLNKQNKAITLQLPHLDFSEQKTREYQFVTQLLDALQQTGTGFDFSPEVRQFLTYLAIASTDLYRFQDCSEDNYQQLLGKAQELQQFILEKLSLHLQVDMFSDYTCYKDLLKMLIPMSIKIELGVSDDVDLGFYDLAVIHENIILRNAISKLKEDLAIQYHYQLSRREQYFIFDIFSGMFNRIPLHNKKLKLAIIAINGRLSTQQLKFNLRRYFSDYIEKIDTKVLYELAGMKDRQYDYYLCSHYGKNMNIPYQPIYYADENMSETDYESSLNDIFYHAYPYHHLPKIECFCIDKKFTFNLFPIEDYLEERESFADEIIEVNGEKIQLFFSFTSQKEYFHLYHFQHHEDMTLHGIKQFVVMSLAIKNDLQKLKMCMNILNQISTFGNLLTLCQSTEKSYKYFFTQKK